MLNTIVDHIEQCWHQNLVPFCDLVLNPKWKHKLFIAADRREAAHYSCDTRVENRHSGS